jgi:hypothetical protein
LDGGYATGNAAIVPPPAEKMMEWLHALEKFLQRENEDLPILVKTALVRSLKRAVSAET